MNLNITIINDMVIKSLRNSLNRRSGVSRRGPIFEVSCWRLAVPLSWWFIWLFTMKGVELIHLYSETWREEFRATDGAGTSLVSNTSTAFVNTLLYHEEI